MVQKTAVMAKSAALPRAGSGVRLQRSGASRTQSLATVDFWRRDRTGGARTANIHGNCCPPRKRAAATTATAHSQSSLIDTVSRLEHDASYRKQRIGTTSNRHWRRRLVFTNHESQITSHCLLPVTVCRVEHDATHRKQRPTVHSTRHRRQRVEFTSHESRVTVSYPSL
jgi:hypothetical protein